MPDNEICKTLSRVPVGKRPTRGAMFMTKGSPFVGFFNTKIVSLFERGVRNRLQKDYDRKTSPSCLLTGSSQKEPLGFNDVFTAFVILMGGYFASLVVFFWEIIFQCKVLGR